MKEHLTKIFQAASLNFSGSIMKVAIGFVSLPIITRLLSQDLYGVFILATTIAFIANRVISLGIPGALSYFIPKFIVEKNEPSVRSLFEFTFSIHIALSIIMYAALYIASNQFAILFHEPELANVLKIVAASIPFLVIIDDIGNIFSGTKNATVPIILNSFFQPLVRIALISAFLLLGYELFGISVAHTVALAATALIFGYYFFVRILPQFPERAKTFSRKTILAYAIPLSMSEVIFLVLGYTDVIMTGKILESNDVAVYNIAYNLAKILNLLPVAILILYKPISSQLFAEKNITAIGEMLKYIARWIVIINIPLLTAFTVLPKEILSIVFQPEYIFGVLSLQLLTVGYFIATLFGPITQLFEASGRTKITLVNASIIAVMNIILNATLIPIYGVAGAAMATGCALIAMAALSAVEIYLLFHIHPFSKELLYTMTLGAANIFLFWVVTQYIAITTLFAATIAGILFCIFYLITLLLTKIVSSEDKNFLKTLMKRKK